MQQLTDWLTAYKRAWETQDADTFVNLFTGTSEYRDTPFMEPVPHADFHAFWRALAGLQKENAIDFEVLCQSDDRAVVNWRAESTRRDTGERREGNGIFLLTFAADGRCSELREWQHWHPKGVPPERRSFTWKNS